VARIDAALVIEPDVDFLSHGRKKVKEVSAATPYWPGLFSNLMTLNTNTFMNGESP